MMKVKIILAMFVWVLASGHLVAQEDAKNDFSGNLSGNWGGARSRLADKGIDFTLAYIGGFHSNVAGGIKKGSAYNGQMNLGLDIDFEKLSSWGGASFHANGFWIHGKDGTAEFVGDAGGYNNLFGEKTVRLYTLWLQQNILDNKLSFRLGSIAMDDEFGGSDLGALFINSSFGVTPAFSANMAIPIYAEPALGLRVRYDVTANVWVQLGVFDGNPAHIAADGRDDNRHGTDFRLGDDDGIFSILEAGYKKSEGLTGTYKIGLGYHSAKFFEIVDPTKEVSGNYTFYLAADQMILHRPDSGECSGLGVFFRLALAPKNRNTVTLSSEAGVTCKGIFGREDDTLGLGFAYIKLNPTGSESTLELAYSAQVTPWLSLQPDIQYILNPGGSSSGLKDALVVGLRGVVNF